MTYLLYWIKEREAIRLQRERGLGPPWTKDWIFQTFRFTNVRRRHDRVSQWLIKYVLNKKVPKARRAEFIAWVALCRYINWPPTIKMLMDAGLNKYPLDWRAIGKLIDKRSRSGEKTWTGAYMVKGKPQGKGKYIANTLGKNFAKHGDAVVKAVATQSCLQVYTVLRGMKECGPFFAGQIVADLTYSPLFKDAYDLYTWAPLGPGSRRGYNRLMSITPLRIWPNENDFVMQLITWRQEMVKHLGYAYVDVTLMDFQNCLCEYDKYCRVENKEGRPRAKYVSHAKEYEV